VPSQKNPLPWLLGGAIGAAGILQGLHWRSATSGADLTEMENQLRIAGEENALLKRENESLRSLAQGGGEVAVPQEIITRVEKETGLRFRSSPVVHRIATEELHDRVTAAIESRYGPAGIDDRQEAYKLIGWLRPGDELLSQLAATRSLGATGWFDDTSGEAWVTDRFELANIPDQAALVRLATRILLHQNFPPPPAYPGDDEARAREALQQGAAAGSEARFLTANARAIGFMPMKRNSAAEQLMASLPTFLQGLVTFPSTEGKGLADTLHVQGTERFQAAFRNPPLTTRAILYPAEPAAEPQALDLPATPEEPFLTETGGQLGLRLWLAPRGAEEIANDWKNDRYVLFPDGEESVAVLWEIELRSAEATDRLQSTSLEIIAEMAASAAPATPGQALVSPEKRNLLVTRPSPTRLRFLNTREPATAAKLGGR
jgi:hypothetical protein